MHTPETRKKMSDSKKKFFANGGIHPLLGKHHSDATKSKISNALLGEKHPQWKGGKFHSSNGYIWTYFPKHPFASKVSPVGYVLEHRLIMEKKIGRYLQKSEIVHHINGIRDDNRIENLVLTTSGKHIAQHNSERVWKKESKNKASINAKNRKRDKGGKFVNIK